MEEKAPNAPVAIVGAGLMGFGIAACLAAAGHEVAVHDPVAESLAAAPDRIASCLEAIGVDGTEAGRIRFEARPQDAVAGAAFVFEAAPEDLKLKQEIFARLGAIAAPGCILASNSSAIRPTEIFARAEHPGRTVGTHWWNPPHLVPLVEVVRGERTSDETVERTFELLAAVGKVPVRVDRDKPGFVGNRLQHALWREAHDYLLPRLTPPSRPSPGLRERIAAGHTGMEAGEGWRRWPAGAREEVQASVSRHLREAAARRAGTENAGAE